MPWTFDGVTPTADSKAYTLDGSGPYAGQGILAATEAIDGAVAAGILVTTSVAAALDSLDTVAAAGALLTTAASVALESPDSAVATGTLTTSGSLATTDSAESASATGMSTIAAAGLASESLDAVVAAGVLISVGVAAAGDAPDAITAAGASAITGAAALVEGGDALTAAGALTATGALAATEAPDSALTVAYGPRSRFGYAMSVTGRQSSYAGTLTYFENVASTVRIAYFTYERVPFKPQAVSYRIDDLDTGVNIVPWTAIQPDLVNEIQVTAAQNTLISLTRAVERHQVLFQIIDGFGDTHFAGVSYELLRVLGVPVS